MIFLFLRRNINRWFISTLCILMSIYFLLFQQIYLPNMGGSGLSLPLNLEAWSLMLIISALLLAKSGICGKAVCSNEIYLGVLAAILMTLPLLWTPEINYSNALPRLAAIWGAVVISFALQQLRFSASMKRALLMLIMISALLECALGIFQWGWSDVAQRVMEFNAEQIAGRPYGIFQQPNLLASFVATGYAIAVYFLYTTTDKRFRFVWMLLQSIMLFMLMHSGSRVGIYGAFFSLFLISSIALELRQNKDDHLCGIYPPRYSIRTRWLVISLLFSCGVLLNVASGIIQKPILVSSVSLLIILLGMAWCFVSGAKDRQTIICQQCCFAMILICMLILLISESALTNSAISAQQWLHTSLHASPEMLHTLDLLHTGSNNERLNILRGTLVLIRQHPLTGVGLGGFESAFAAIRPSIDLNLYIQSYTITHPHNEVMYVWSEGGLLALLGLLCAAAACFLPVFIASRSRRATKTSDLTSIAGNNDALVSAVLMVPITLHVLFEYPFYQSAPHLLVFLLLARLGQREKKEFNQHGQTLYSCKKTSLIFRISAFTLSIFLLAATVELLSGLKVQEQLSTVERHDLRSFPTTLPLLTTITQYDRYDFDQHTLLLLKYNYLHDDRLLDKYFSWGQTYIKVHNDANVYDSIIRIANHKGERELAAKLSASAMRSFYADKRFAPLPNEQNEMSERH